MVDNKYIGKNDRLAVLADFKARVFDMMENGFVAPEIGIYDEPVRYFKLNLQWCRILAGLLSIAEHVAFWPEAEDTNYSGIQGFLEFEKGIEALIPVFPDESCCFNYLPSSPFVAYEPQNPYTEPDYTPPDYLVPPFLVNTALEYPEALGYQATDVFTPISAINIDPIDLLTVNLPTIILSVKGSGQIELDLLGVQGGGLAIIKVGSMPNIAEILSGGAIGDVTICDLNTDVLGIPPETDILISEEINIEVVDPDEITQVYIVFAPVVDDAVIPLRYGGGIRQIGLCGLEQGVEAGVEDVRFNVATCEFEKMVGGVWVTMEGGGDWLDCVPTGGGSGGGTQFRATQYAFELGANQDTTSTTMVEAAGTAQLHQYLYSNALVFAELQALNTNAGANIFFEIRNNDLAPTSAVNRVGGNVGEVLYTTATFTGLDKVNPSTLSIYFRANANTARIGTGSRMLYTILEYENAADLYVTAVRIQGRELQYQIAGVWITATESLNDILQDIQDIATNALTVANNAAAVNGTQNTQIANIIGVNNAQNTLIATLNSNVAAITVVNNNQDDRLDILEADVADLTLSVAQHNLDIAQLDAGFETLAAGGVWTWLHDFTIDNSWSAIQGAWAAGNGWISDGGSLIIQYLGETIKENQISHIQASVVSNAGTPVIISFNTDGVTNAVVEQQVFPNVGRGWLRVPNMDVGQFLVIRMQSYPTGNFVLKSLRYLGRGTTNPFD